MHARRVAASGLLAALLARGGAAQAGLPLEEGVVYRIDPATARVRFELPATLHRVHGRSDEVSGAVLLRRGEDGYDLEGSVRIPAVSLHTGNARRDRRMLAESLLAAVHPDILFEPRRLRALESEPAVPGRGSFRLEGDLSVRGVSRPVALRLEVASAGGRLLVDGETELAWADFGVPDPSFLLVRIAKRLSVGIHVELVP